MVHIGTFVASLVMSDDAGCLKEWRRLRRRALGTQREQRIGKTFHSATSASLLLLETPVLFWTHKAAKVVPTRFGPVLPYMAIFNSFGPICSSTRLSLPLVPDFCRAPFISTPGCCWCFGQSDGSGHNIVFYLNN